MLIDESWTLILSGYRVGALAPSGRRRSRGVSVPSSSVRWGNLRDPRANECARLSRVAGSVGTIFADLAYEVAWRTAIRAGIVLITGGAGFSGSHTVDRLTAAARRVVVLDDFSTSRRANLAQWAIRGSRSLKRTSPNRMPPALPDTPDSTLSSTGRPDVDTGAPAVPAAEVSAWRDAFWPPGRRR